MSKRFAVAALPVFWIATACGSSGGSDDQGPQPPSASLDGGASEGDPNVLEFQAKVEPLAGFHFDTGMFPHGGSVAVDFGVTEKGELEVDAKADSVGTKSEPGLRAIPKTGKITLEIHYQLLAKLHVDVDKVKYDGDIPAITTTDIHFSGKTTFDPFLLDGQSVEMPVDPHNTVLPEIGLPKGVPGQLRLTISNKSKLKLRYEGICASSHDGKATYRGRATTEGKINLKVAIDLSFKGLVSKAFDLGSIDVPVPPAHVDLGSTVTADLFEGALLPTDVVSSSCGNAPPATPASGDPDGGVDASPLPH